MLFHHYVVCSRLDDDPAFLECLARMYGQYKLHNEAFCCFNNMGDRSDFMWNFMIGLCSEQQANERTSFQLFSHSIVWNKLPDISDLLVLLSLCKDGNTLTWGKRLHVLVKSIATESNVAVGTALLSMYSRCNDFEKAKILFDQISQRSIVSWNAMIAACVHHDKGMEAIQVFLHIQQHGLLPNVVTFVSTTSACANELDWCLGKSLHVQATNRGLGSSIVLATALVSMYGKWSSIENAYNAFQEVNVPCVVLWTVMLKVYCQQRHLKKVFYMHSQMQEMGILPNDVTFLCMLSASNHRDLLAAGKRVHAQVLCSSLDCSNTIMSTALAVMYGRCGSIEESNQEFISLAEKSKITWNAMILTHIDNRQSSQGIQLYRDMQQQGINPDNFTFVNVIHACRCLLSSFEGRVVHQCILETKFSSDIVVCNALIDMYGKCNQLAVARMVFDRMPLRSTVSWNTLMAAYDQNGYYEKAWALFCQMQCERISPDAVTYASILSVLAQKDCGLDCWRVHKEIIYKGFDSDLAVMKNIITMYGKHGSLKSARLAFDSVCEKGDNAWAVLMKIYSQPESTQALQLLNEMRNQGLAPCRETLVNCLSTCPGTFALARTRQLHVSILHSGAESGDIELCVLIYTYAECGDLQKALELFNISKRNKLLCNCMLGALAVHGGGMEVPKLFEEMQQSKISADAVTLLNLLSAFNHSGFVEDAFEFLTLMGLQLVVFHYDCVVDILGRVGQLDEAMLLAGTMPFKPTAVTWTCLLGACKSVMNLQGGEIAAAHLYEISHDGFLPYIFLLKIYSDIEDNGKQQLCAFGGMIGGLPLQR